jgi:hypothetical protein
MVNREAGNEVSPAILQSKFTHALYAGSICFTIMCFRYGLWRTLTGRHSDLEFSCMEVGHTKFHPDWHFSLWKVFTHPLSLNKTWVCIARSDDLNIT